MNYPKVEMTPERLDIQRIVCSAVLDPKSGRIWCGPRHANCLWQANEAIKLDGADLKMDNLVQGFVDQFFNFLTREEAWVIAEKMGQIVRRVGGDMPRLYSENLY